MFKNLCVCITLILKFVFKNKQINELVWPYAFRLQEIVFLGLLKHHGGNLPTKKIQDQMASQVKYAKH